jgi:hypothetical protein
MTDVTLLKSRACVFAKGRLFVGDSHSPLCPDDCEVEPGVFVVRPTRRQFRYGDSERSTKSKCRREPDVTPGVAQRFKSYGNRFGEIRIARAHDTLNERGIIVHRVRVLVEIVPKDIRLFRAFGDLKRPCGIYARDHIRRLNLIVQPSAPTVGDLKRQTIQCGFLTELSLSLNPRPSHESVSSSSYHRKPRRATTRTCAGCGWEALSTSSKNRRSLGPLND